MIVSLKPVPTSWTKLAAPPISGEARSRPAPAPPSQWAAVLSLRARPFFLSDGVKLTHVPSASGPRGSARVIPPANQRERRAADTPTRWPAPPGVAALPARGLWTPPPPDTRRPPRFSRAALRVARPGT